MELTKIVIENYKSIQSPVTISFSPNMPTVLIGKNGCGKTTILEALNYIGKANEEGSNGIADLSYRAYFKLSDDECAEVPADVVCNDHELVMYGDAEERSRLDRKPSKEETVYYERDIGEIRDLHKELRKEIDEYCTQANSIFFGRWRASTISQWYCSSGDGEVFDYRTTKDGLVSFRDRVEETIQYLENKLDKGLFEPNMYDRPIALLAIVPCWKLEYVQRDLNDFERSYIRIDKKGIQEEVNRFNEKTEERCKRITDLAKQIAERINGLLDNIKRVGDEQQEREKKYESYLREVRTTICRKCLFFRNENNDVLFQARKGLYDFEDVESIRSTPILRAYFEYVYQGEDKRDLLQLLRNNQSPPEHARKKFEESLNENIPEFDKGAYERITVGSTDGNISIKLHEKTGSQVDLNQTSAGRRWYFTYWFLKKTMTPGDLFIIDEPAAMLHPSAQKEILKDIEALAQKGIKVVYSTHSPYLIPNEWGSVKFVYMGDGIEVSGFDLNTDEFREFQAFSPIDVFGYQEIDDYFRKSQYKVRITMNVYRALTETFKDQSVEKIALDVGVQSRTIYNWAEAVEKEKKGEKPKLISFSSIVRVSILLKKDLFEFIKDMEN